MKCVFLAELAAGAVLAQSAYTQGDIEAGREFFGANCMYCHGPEAVSVPGVALAQGKFKRASSDEDLVKIIREGIPGTAMPANDNIVAFEAENIIAYLRSIASTTRATSVPGDAVRGKALFESKGGCLNCHRVKDNGSRVGPDLTEIGLLRRSVELERSILEPNAQILPENRFVRMVTRDGVAVVGRLLNHDRFTVQLIDDRERLRSFVRSALRELTIDNKSSMPPYKDKLSAAELADIISYLVSSKGN